MENKQKELNLNELEQLNGGVVMPARPDDDDDDDENSNNNGGGSIGDWFC